MTITDRIKALPEMPDKSNADRLMAQFPENKVITASAIASFSQDEADALRARLSLLHDAARVYLERVRQLESLDPGDPYDVPALNHALADLRAVVEAIAPQESE